MSNKHNLKQLEQFAKEWGLFRWMNAYNVDNEKPQYKKPYAKPNTFKGKYDKKRK